MCSYFVGMNYYCMQPTEIIIHLYMHQCKIPCVILCDNHQILLLKTFNIKTSMPTTGEYNYIEMIGFPL